MPSSNSARILTVHPEGGRVGRRAGLVSGRARKVALVPIPDRLDAQEARGRAELGGRQLGVRGYVCALGVPANLRAIFCKGRYKFRSKIQTSKPI